MDLRILREVWKLFYHVTSDSVFTNEIPERTNKMQKYKNQIFPIIIWYNIIKECDSMACG